MKITIEFSSLEEFDSFRGYPLGESPVPFQTAIPESEPVPAPKRARKSAPKAEPIPEETIPEPDIAKGEVKPDPIPEPEPSYIQDIPADEPEQEPAPVDYELLRLDVRKTLAELNRTHDGKPAQELIKKMGYKGLSDVPGEELQGLMDAAKEMM